MKKMISIIASIIALTVMAPGHAEEVQETKHTFLNQMVTGAQDRFETLVDVLSKPIIDINFTSKDLDCLAHNIYYEAGGEPEEGKVAVAMVTINRVRDGRFGKTICSVVDQRTVRVKERNVTKTETVSTGWFGRPEKQTTKTIVMEQVPICQFSWKCMFVRKPKPTDERWTESKRVAEETLKGAYGAWQVKYSEALYFHSTGVRPSWAPSKERVNRIGGHIFYAERNK